MRRKRYFSSNFPQKHQKISVTVQSEEPTIFCEHGPCLLFERKRADENEGEKFFACSVYRNRKVCSFYLPFEKRESFKAENFKKFEPVTSETIKNLYTRLTEIRKLRSDFRGFCVDCQKLVIKKDTTAIKESAEHTGHKLEWGITDVQLKNPSKLLAARQDSDKEAQYWFSKSTLNFLTDTIRDLKFDAVLCIGVPRLHELLLLGAEYNKNPISSFLLDIDGRYGQFYSPRFFAQFNVFANYFHSAACEKHLRKFMEESANLLIVCDPPFGGMASLIADTMQNLGRKFSAVAPSPKKSDKNAEEAAKTEKSALAEKSLSFMWIFPYFLEPKIHENWPEMKMSDYQVEYENHPLYKTSDKKHGSPIRIFTTISLNVLKLPENKYRFCKKCDRYVLKENAHCNTCGICPSKDGKPYVHCKSCRKCVKPTYKHCKQCDRCHLTSRCFQKDFNSLDTAVDSSAAEVKKNPMEKMRGENLAKKSKRLKVK